MTTLVVAGIGVAVGLANRDATHARHAPSSGAMFVEAEGAGDTWEVLRGDGTTSALDLRHDSPRPTLGLSPDGRWISYAQGPESGGILDLYLLRSDQVEPRHVRGIAATWGFAHQWSPDSQHVLVPVVDGDINLVDADTGLVAHQYGPGTAAGFVDNDSLGWVAAEGSRGDEGLTWKVTGFRMTSERSLPLQVDRELLNPAGWAQLMVEQASLSPDRSRVAALLTNYRGQARLLVFSTGNGALLARHDTNEAVNDLVCPLRWQSGSAVLTRRGETCVIKLD